MSDYWDGKFTGRYTKIPWTVLDDFADDLPGLGRWVREYVAEDRARRERRRYVPRVVWEAALRRFRFACAYCGATGIPLQREHRVPVVKGGLDDEANIVPACEPCNRKKGTQDPSLWPVREPA